MTGASGQVTTTVAAGTTWGGGWLSLNHPIREGLPINFSAVLPAQVQPALSKPDHGRHCADRARHARQDLSGWSSRIDGAFRWTGEIVLNGGQQSASFDAAPLGNINELVWVMDRAATGDIVVLDSIAFTATTRITDTATAAFVWSYGMLLNNWNPVTGLVRDKGQGCQRRVRRHPGDGQPGRGDRAGRTAWHRLSQRRDPDRKQDQRYAAASAALPRPVAALDQDFSRRHAHIAWGTEWSSMDTVIAAIGLLTAQQALGLDTSGTEQVIRDIDWDDLTKPDGMISMGYDYNGVRLASTWNTFGGESWLVELAYASATGKVAPLTHPSPPTANGSGFIDELAVAFRAAADRDQTTGGQTGPPIGGAPRTAQIRYYPANYPESCFARLGLFGLSAAEVADPSLVPPGSIYQAFGVGGRDSPANDGSALLGAPVVVPHYAALIASLRPDEAIRMWDWLIQNGLFSPLNNAESVMFPAGAPCDSAGVVWNQLKGSWNLSLQTLGWGRYLAEQRGQIPVLWQATLANAFLRRGYCVLAPGGPCS